MVITVQRVPGEFAVHRLAPDADVPAAAWNAPFASVSRSQDELSVITGAGVHIASDRVEGPWLAYRVKGAIDFSVTGVMSALTVPLAEADIGIIAVGTFDTDYVLVRADAGIATEIAWRAAGIAIESA